MRNKQKYLIGLGILAALIVAYFVVDSFLFTGIKPLKISEDGFHAEFYAKKNQNNKPAVIIIGGGGQEGYYWGAEIVEKGFVVLALPYYHREGLPDLPEEIPLEYFERAINWLKEQPEVNPDKIVLMGASRNAELALVVASNLVELRGGVIAFAPSAVSWSNTVLPFNSDELKPSWTYKGKGIPFLPMQKITGTDANTIETLPYWEAGLKKLDQFPDAHIPVENIQGDILLLSGKEDQIWPAASMSNMIEARLKEHTFPYNLENVQFEDAGHLISRNIPSISKGRTGQMRLGGKSYEFSYGGSIQGDEAAHLAAKEKIFQFLYKLESNWSKLWYLPDLI